MILYDEYDLSRMHTASVWSALTFWTRMPCAAGIGLQISLHQASKTVAVSCGIAVPETLKDVNRGLTPLTSNDTAVLGGA